MLDKLANNNCGKKKKYTLFRIYEIISEYTDETHHLMHKEIQEKLMSLYGLQIERKNIRECIDDINFLGKPYGIEVYSRKGNGAYLMGRRFEKSEIRFLIDAVFSSRSIGQKQAQDLTAKLQKYLSKYDVKSFDYLTKSGDVVRTDNKQVFYNIDVLLDAIKHGSKVAFNYKRNYVDKIKDDEKRKRRLVVSPYYLVNNQGKYYVVCNNDKFDDIANYRIERMFDIEITDSKARQITTLNGCENGFDIVKYSNDNIYMFSIDSVNATIRIYNDYVVSYVMDWFGQNAQIYVGQDDGALYANIHGNEKAIIYWCLQYGENVELLEPQQTRQKIKDIVANMTNKYNN